MAVASRFSTYLSDQTAFHDLVITEDWDSYKSAEWDATRRFEIASLFALIQPTRILDIGCGCGFHDVEMARYSFVERIDAVDPSPKSVEQAERHFGDLKVRRWVSGFQTLADEPVYDMAMSVDMFEHLDQPEAYFAKMAKIVRPGGWVVIFTPNRRRWSNTARRLRGQQPVLMSVMHWKEYVPTELFAMGRAVGLKRFAHFGYGLEGPGAHRFSHERRLRLGKSLAPIAHGLCVVLQR